MQFQTNQPLNSVISVIRDFVIAALMIGGSKKRELCFSRGKLISELFISLENLQ